VLQIAALTAQVAALTNTLYEQIEAISTLNITIASQANTIDDLTATVAARDATIVEMQAINDELKHTIERYEKQWPDNTCPKCGFDPKE
jgi:uncharacterized coiled-coil protein SlyX